MKLIREIFSTSNKHKIWLNLECLIVKFLSLNGYISKTLCEKIISNLKVPPFEFFGNVKKREDEWNSFKRMLYSEMKFFDKELMDFSLSKDNFSDIANVLMIKEAGEAIKKKGLELKEKLKELALRYKDLEQIGRTHGIHAEPTSFGYRYVVYYEDISRELDEFFSAIEKCNCICLNHNCLFDSSLSVKLQDFLSKYLNISSTGFSSTYPKHKYERLLKSLSLMAQTISRIINDFNLLQIVGEVKIKDNNVDILSKIIQGYANIELFNFERTEKERKILFEVFNNSYLLLFETIKILGELEVKKEKIKKNIQLTNGTIFSNTVMCHLINNIDDSRIELLRNLKEISRMTNNNDCENFREGLRHSKYFEYIDDSLFEIEYHLRFMDELYEKVLIPKKNEENIDFFVDDLSKKLNEFYDSQGPVLVVAFFERTLSFLSKLLIKLKFPLTLLNIDYEVKLHPLVVDKFEKQKILILDYFVGENSLLPNLVVNLKRAKAEEVNVCALYKFSELKNNDIVKWYGTLSHNRDYS